MKPADPNESLWSLHSAEWREPAQIVSQWKEASGVDGRLLESKVSGNWWGVLEELGITLFVTREYEHLVLALSAVKGRARSTYLPLPHPSGLVVDRKKNRVHIASTRNPNQVFLFEPATGLLERGDNRVQVRTSNPMVPVSSTYFPGSLYMHDLALIGDSLHANAVGHNAVVKLSEGGRFQRVWWPKCVVKDGTPAFDRNYIQLNSIAAGKTIRESFFSASSSSIGRLRPGHLKYKVDQQGVIFSGRTREPFCTGLTRPHSARLAQGAVWVGNSGYGELGYASRGKLEVLARLPGWTRGLCLTKEIAFVGTSRVIPRYAQYAPGLDSAKSRCGVHAISLKTGRVLGSIEWLTANQIFAIDWIRSSVSSGFLFEAQRLRKEQELAFFYRYLLRTNSTEDRLGAK